MSHPYYCLPSSADRNRMNCFTNNINNSGQTNSTVRLAQPPRPHLRTTLLHIFSNLNPSGYDTNMLNITTLVVLLVILGAYTHALSIRTVSDKKLIKRETDGEFYPDWVPFKNKKGDELGEFVQVKKKRPAKRLAPPVNFVLRPVAELEGDDYYEKGQGESDDYYEKKEWSDQLRAAKQAAPANVVLNTTEVSDIEGIVNIITDKRPTVETDPTTSTETDSLAIAAEENKLPTQIIEDVLIDTNKEDSEVKIDSNETDLKDKEDRQENSKDEAEVGLLLPIVEYQDVKKETTVEDTPDSTVAKKPKEYNDYEDENAEKAKPEQTEEEKQEAEAKKQRILGLVDDLKRQHEKEQREISERAKEDEIIKEERDRELSRGSPLNSNEADEGYDKYNTKNYNKDRSKPYYDDYDDTTNVDDKYKIHPLTKKQPPVTTTIAPLTSTSSRVRTPKKKRMKATPNKHRQSGKLSVFRTPKLYMYDDDISDEASTVVSSTKTPKKSSRKTYRAHPTSSSTSSSPTTPALLTSNDSNESVRISLVPEDNEMKDGEPTLFFPQRRINKRRRKNKRRSSTPEPDSYVAESKGVRSPDNNGTEFSTQSTLETKAVLLSSEEAILTSPTAPSASGEGIDSAGTEDSSPLAAATSSAVSDAVASASGHTEPKHENYHTEKGKCFLSLIFSII